MAAGQIFSIDTFVSDAMLPSPSRAHLIIPDLLQHMHKFQDIWTPPVLSAECLGIH